jgi:hypothetical protein
LIYSLRIGHNEYGNGERGQTIKDVPGYVRVEGLLRVVFIEEDVDIVPKRSLLFILEEWSSRGRVTYGVCGIHQ